MNQRNDFLDLVSILPRNTQDIKQEMTIKIDYELYKHSFRIKEGVLFYAIRYKWKDYLVLSSSDETQWDFVGETFKENDNNIHIFEETPHNCLQLRTLFPDLNPVPIGKEKSTFGVGDRIGMAAAGHISAFDCFPSFAPILAQQSLRELDLTGRTYRDVIDAAIWGVFKTGYRGLWGADGDHLKEASSVQSALKQGCTMITADLSDHLCTDADILSDAEVTLQYKQIPEAYRTRVEKDYLQIKSLDSALSLDFPEKKAKTFSPYI